MSENIFHQCRRRLVTLITRRSIGYRYSLPSDNASITCSDKFGDCLDWKRMLFFAGVESLILIRFLFFFYRPMGQFLEKPKVEKHNDRGKNDDIRYGLGSMQGWR